MFGLHGTNLSDYSDGKPLQMRAERPHNYTNFAHLMAHGQFGGNEEFIECFCFRNALGGLTGKTLIIYRLAYLSSCSKAISQALMK